jgi:hypothetical protein
MVGTAGEASKGEVVSKTLLKRDEESCIGREADDLRRLRKEGLRREEKRGGGKAGRQAGQRLIECGPYETTTENGKESLTRTFEPYDPEATHRRLVPTFLADTSNILPPNPSE